MNPQTQTTPTAAYPSTGSLPGPLATLATANANWLTGQTGQTGPGYPYAMTAGLTPSQTAAIGGAANVAGPYLSTAAPGAANVNAILGGATSPQNNPYLSGLLGGLQNQEASDIATLHSTYGAGPGVNAGLGEMQANIQAPYAAAAANLGETAFNQDVQNRLNVLPYTTQMPSTAISELAATGGTAQQTQQTALTNAYNEWVRQQGLPYQTAQLAGPLTAQAFSPIGQQTTTYPSLFSQLAGAAGSALPYYFMRPQPASA